MSRLGASCMKGEKQSIREGIKLMMTHVPRFAMILPICLFSFSSYQSKSRVSSTGATKVHTKISILVFNPRLPLTYPHRKGRNLENRWKSARPFTSATNSGRQKDFRFKQKFVLMRSENRVPRPQLIHDKNSRFFSSFRSVHKSSFYFTKKTFMRRGRGKKKKSETETIPDCGNKQ